MNESAPSSSNTVSASSPSTPWGYEQPACRGANALLLFTEDLARVIESHLAGRAVERKDVTAAQAGIDDLLARYVALSAHPQAFDDQTITLRIEVDRTADGVEIPYVALATSPILESALIDAQQAATPPTNQA